MFEGEAWYEFLDEPMRDLVDQSFYLLEKQEMEGMGFHDYSFVVFPAAKAYEGFVKKFLKETAILESRQVNSRLFRVGKSLNPALPPKYRGRDWVWDDLQKLCGTILDQEVARAMWKAWRLARNKTFHFFPKQHKNLSLEAVREKLELVVEAMKLAVACKLKVESGVYPPAKEEEVVI